MQGSQPPEVIVHNIYLLTQLTKLFLCLLGSVPGITGPGRERGGTERGTGLERGGRESERGIGDDHAVGQGKARLQCVCVCGGGGE